MAYNLATPNFKIEFKNVLTKLSHMWVWRSRKSIYKNYFEISINQGASLDEQNIVYRNKSIIIITGKTAGIEFSQKPNQNNRRIVLSRRTMIPQWYIYLVIFSKSYNSTLIDCNSGPERLTDESI